MSRAITFLVSLRAFDIFCVTFFECHSSDIEQRKIYEFKNTLEIRYSESSVNSRSSRITVLTLCFALELKRIVVQALPACRKGVES